MTTNFENSVLPHSSWNVRLEPGEPVEVCGLPYYFDRVDPDGLFTFRPPLGSDAGEFMVHGSDGRPRKPNAEQLSIMWREGSLKFRGKPLSDDVRRHARAQELDATQAHAMDKRAPFRMAICRRFDANPWSKSDRSLIAFMKEALADPVISTMEGARPACPATLRSWFRERGTEGCRKARDGISMTGRMPRKLRIEHPLEIAMYWAVRQTNLRGDVQKAHDLYSGDISKINKGDPLNRFFFIDPDGEAGACERPAKYPVPQRPYTAMSYSRFWRLCRSLRSARAYKSKTSAKAEYQRYGGGGVSDLATHLGAFVWMDETPVPKIFFVDDQTGIPIGVATLTLMLEAKSKVIVGWNLSPGPASSSTVLETVLHANLPKEVPEDLHKIDPNLCWLRLKPGTIGFDNSTGNHSRSVEDILGDAYIAARWVGNGMARDKTHMERVIGTFQDLIFGQMSDANYDVVRMRRYGYDPEKHVICSIRTGRRLLDRAVMTYNVTGHSGLDGRQPALVWKQELQHRKLDKIQDEDEFRASVGNVEFDMVMTNAGIEKFNRRYTPGTGDMKRIIQQFETGIRIPKNDITPKQRKQSDDRKRPSYRVKGKYNPGDIGTIRIWNPYAAPARWEIFSCTDPNTHGMPRWLHDRCLELAKAEALEYATAEQQAYVRARLFEEIANVDAKSAERDRLAVAKAADDPKVRAVFGQYVEIVDEVVDDYCITQPEEHPPVGHQSAVGKRKDAAVKTPRAKIKPESEPARMPRQAVVPTAPPLLDLQRRERKNARDDDRRNAGVHHQSAHRPDQRTPKRRSNLKWGDEF